MLPRDATMSFCLPPLSMCFNSNRKEFAPLEQILSFKNRLLSEGFHHPGKQTGKISPRENSFLDSDLKYENF